MCLVTTQKIPAAKGSKQRGNVERLMLFAEPLSCHVFEQRSDTSESGDHRDPNVYNLADYYHGHETLYKRPQQNSYRVPLS